MATTLQHKRSSSSGAIPSTASLALGEIAINTVDGYLYTKKSILGVESVVKFTGSATAAEAAITVDVFTGDGTTTAFNLSTIPEADQFAFASINGVQQQIDAYSLSSGQLTFSSAPSSGDAIEVRVISIRSTSVVLRDMKKYFYTITGTTGSVSGADDYSTTLAYDIGMVDVYQNGVRLIEGSDFTANTGTSVIFITSLENGDIVEIVSYARTAILDADAIKPNLTLLPNTATDQVVDTFSASAYRTAKYIVQASVGTAYHATEILIMHDGTTVYTTEYATMYSGSSLITLNADIVNNTVRLLATPTTNSTTVKLQRITVAI